MADDDESEVAGMVAEMEASIGARLKVWQESLGHRFYLLISNRDVALKATTHRNWMMREAAFQCLHTRWKSQPESEVLYAKAVLTDKSPEVRMVALFWWAVWYAGTRDPNVSRITAWLALDVDAPMCARRAGLLFFWMTRGRPVTRELLEALERTDDGLPPEADIPWVRKFAAGRTDDDLT